jgi:hypothetical protein
MIRVQVGEKDGVYSLPGYLDLVEPLKSAPACVKNELLPGRFDEGARAEPVHNGRRASCAQEGNFDFLRLCGRWENGEGK